jgi:AcrR family transcriptional regulator
MNELLARRIERKQRRRADNRSAIVEAARSVATREGAGAISLRAVAAEAGYAPASVYEYFRNRGELILALAAEDLGVLARALRESGSAAGEGRPKFAGAAAVALELLRGSGALPAAVSALAGAEAPPEAERLFNGKLIAALTAFAEACGRTPVSSRDEQADIVLAAAAIVGLAALSRAGRLKALGFEDRDLLERLEKRFAGAGPKPA